MTNPLVELKALGQSVWLDDIDRGQLRSGAFERLIEEDGLSGATGNPTMIAEALDRFERHGIHGVGADQFFDVQHIAVGRIFCSRTGP